MPDTGLITALGAIIGLVLALTGAGGGILAAPLLVWGLHTPLQVAGPMGLAAVGLASALGALLGLREGLVRWRAALLMGAAGMVSAPLGVAIAQWLPAKPLLWLFAGVMGWVGWQALRASLADTVSVPATNLAPGATRPVCQVNSANGRIDWTAPCARALAATGGMSGLLSGLIGVGGGFVIVPTLIRHSDLDLRQVQATSLAVIALVSISGVGTAAWHGALDAHLAPPFAGGAMLALLAGRQLALQLPEAKLKQGFGWLTLAVGASLVVKAMG